MNSSGDTADVIPLPSSLEVLALCLHEELGRAFLKVVCSRISGAEGETQIEGVSITLRILAGDPRGIPGWDEAVREADGCLLLVRFLDVLSMDRMRTIYRRLPVERALPMLAVIFREDGELDFKVSCPACGQKLWVRDGDVGRRGRCPNCQKAFRLPSQAGFLRSQLMLPDAVSTLTVVNGRAASCRGALANLVGQMNGAVVTAAAGMSQDTLKKTTVRVQVQPEQG